MERYSTDEVSAWVSFLYCNLPLLDVDNKPSGDNLVLLELQVLKHTSLLNLGEEVSVQQLLTKGLQGRIIHGRIDPFDNLFGFQIDIMPHNMHGPLIIEIDDHQLPRGQESEIIGLYILLF